MAWRKWEPLYFFAFSQIQEKRFLRAGFYGWFYALVLRLVLRNVFPCVHWIYLV